MPPFPPPPIFFWKLDAYFWQIFTVKCQVLNYCIYTLRNNTNPFKVQTQLAWKILHITLKVQAAQNVSTQNDLKKKFKKIF